MREVNLSNSGIDSLMGKVKSENIKVLRASNNSLDRIEEVPIQICKSLTSLDLSFNNIQKIENLFYLNHLHHLNLSHNQIAIIENLEGLVHLRQLNLSENAIRSIFIRSPLPKLVTLDISGNKLRKLDALSVFPCLSTLRVDGCLLQSLSLHKLLNLRRVTASNNAITDFQPFYLPLLTHLDLHANKLLSLNGCLRFQSLLSLNVSGNPLGDTDFDFPELKEFRADRTNITDPSFVSRGAPNLVLASVTFCRIEKVDAIQKMVENAPKLLYLDTRGNPANRMFYPDVVDGEPLLEYLAEEDYDRKHPSTATVRHDYRDKVLVDSGLGWLDGIRIIDNALSPSQMGLQFVEEPSEATDSESCKSQSQSHSPMQSESESESKVATRNDIGNFIQLTDDESSSSFESVEQLRAAEDDMDASFSAGTDASSEIFYHSHSGTKTHTHANPQRPFVLQDQEFVQTRGGVSFWLPLQTEKYRPVVPSSNAQTPVVPIRGKTDNGHWPFNARTSRQLPWDHESAPPPEPVWKARARLKKRKK